LPYASGIKLSLNSRLLASKVYAKKPLRPLNAKVTLVWWLP